MTTSVVPHLANDQGVEKIFIGVRELNCMGARPPSITPTSISTWAMTGRSCVPIARRFTSTIRGSATIRAIPSAVW